ncbi:MULTISPECIES: double-cubane-cluster-containing anaerobic reductase [Thermodesulfobacterium]|jgi:benzoyl-CoA reductase/2-hydroxyglutaryl-CoA dehydratase subunit BcrC/BadD/HgdB|uniref:3-hydroxyacyl-ACP dehydratase n=2 Tax=Thermodesulfobacterium commune TaxID=1741 RepID=A0A075WSW4_9BACT|nr:MULTISPECIES: double-cubane-cluster-containing anaerobic reductase [Thermodesulfobacterium]KUJ98005.1 MAG: 2-hydroxyglutaryl-CoA dehydratase D-component [Thermodesulfobacterium sp. 37_54]KUK19597.1 MAG: 2-hydroxyglutaryl-CoA dehydratase D-component [Thermodesulfobacterium commune]AIH03961.1 3-hydroxyacyl-ACP dehydratase [Thermodesulfobacterium commune DSM 2178]KUK38361.1 MAG: 2-hydroxyglutaryl-CoA dehydratase D-component [Thermodesulfobacterium commune]MBZ4681852.1 3-hydroxyacyl-ACP dehydra
MGEDYIKMWENLGIDLENHDCLLKALAEFYQQIYLSQENRPEGMKYFDFVVSEAHGLRIKELLEAKQQGKKVVGVFCVYVPEEMIRAVDGICVGLCAGAQIGFEEAEKVLPKNTCDLIKAFIGFKLTQVCPYTESCDLLIGETTCDGKKKAYEILNKLTQKVYVMEVPHMKTERGRELFLKELFALKNKLEELSQQTMTLERFKEEVKVVNEKRKALMRLEKLRSYDPAPISGLDALLVNQIAFYDDPVRFTQKVNELCDELEERVKKGIGVKPKGTPRILITGCPFALPNWKLHHMIETSGAVVVGEESCIGRRYYHSLVPEDFSSIEEGIKLLAERYLKTPCACFTPNPERIEEIQNMAKELKAQGIVYYSIQFCTPYLFEAYQVESAVDLPFLKIDTNYSTEDIGQLKTRCEAFIETL